MKKIITGIICLLFCADIFAQAAVVTVPGSSTFNPSSYLQALDQIYQTYDMINNQITTIEQNYERIQHAIEQAKSFEWKKIEWDGDLDFRNEIGNAVYQVDKQLNNVRKFRDAFNSKNLIVNGKSFSLADLCGISTNPDGSPRQNLADYINAVKTDIERNNRKAKAALKYGVTQNEARYIWAKYGLSPANYNMVMDVKKIVDQKMQEVIGEGETDWEEVRKENEKRLKSVEYIVNMLDKEGELTQKEIGQVQSMLMAKTAQYIEDLRQSIVKASSYQAWKDALEAQEKEAEASSQAEAIEEANEQTMHPGF